MKPICKAAQAELKYINQVPHTDHCVWQPVCLQAYLDETGDYDLLDEPVEAEDGSISTVFERITHAMGWLLADRDERGLNYIAQGDWCDPMNMVGYKGKGVSAWLSVATVYALRLWSDICEETQKVETAGQLGEKAEQISRAVQKHLWGGKWFARGITDNGTVFGVQSELEGQIFLNPQSWAMLAGIGDSAQTSSIIDATEHAFVI